MWEVNSFLLGRLLFTVGWLAAIVLIVLGLSRPEGELKDSYTTELMRTAIEKNWAVVIQERDRALSLDFPPPPKEAGVSDRDYQRLLLIMRQFVAAANWGLGKPFVYENLTNGVRKAVRFNSDAFVYKDPFYDPQPEIVGTPIRASAEAVGQRRGWRVIGRELSLFLSPDAPADEAKVMWGGAPAQDDTLGPPNLVARSFRLMSLDGTGIRVSIGASADARETRTTCRVEYLGTETSAGGGTSDYRSGEYFMWQGQPFAVYEVTPGGSGTDLIVSKKINGQLTRQHLLGAATTNLIGARWRGNLPYLDGALNHKITQDVTLTLDPELQSGSFLMLRQMLERVNGAYGIGRARRGSVAILDERTGAIRALAGYPSYDADGTEYRRILLDDNQLPRNPALEPHMAGSTIKVMTVALGYLLYGNAPLVNLLPTSDNDKAVRQAFQDAYGVALPPPALDSEGESTKETRNLFDKAGGPDRVQRACLDALETVFFVSPNREPNNETEPIISKNLEHFFNPARLEESFYPYRSRWPIKDTKDVETFKRHALGLQDARFTTLRLASVLGVAGTGRAYHPFLVEAVRGRNGSLEKGGQGGVQEINLQWDGMPQRLANMTVGMRPQLEAVLISGGTGFFFVRNKDEKEKRIYLAEDDQSTKSNEGNRAGRDYGKTGTADYEDDKTFQDSLFVYHHGNYLIAVWLEQSDKGKGFVGDEKLWLRHPAHILTYRLVQLIESMEGQPPPTAPKK